MGKVNCGIADGHENQRQFALTFIDNCFFDRKGTDINCGARNHTKNGATPKSLMSRKIKVTVSIQLTKKEMKKLIFYIVFLFLTVTVAFSQSASLVGTYSIKEQGKLKEFMKIEKQGNEFTISEKQGGNWLSPKIVTPVSKSDLGKMLKETVMVDFTGLGNKNVALIKVPKGWRSGKFQCNTGYWLASMLGPIELYKN